VSFEKQKKFYANHKGRGGSNERGKNPIRKFDENAHRTSGVKIITGDHKKDAVTQWKFSSQTRGEKNCSKKGDGGHISYDAGHLMHEGSFGKKNYPPGRRKGLRGCEKNVL